METINYEILRRSPRRPPQNDRLTGFFSALPSMGFLLQCQRLRGGRRRRLQDDSRPALLDQPGGGPGGPGHHHQYSCCRRGDRTANRRTHLASRRTGTWETFPGTLANLLDGRQKILQPFPGQQVHLLWQVDSSCAKIGQNARGIPTKVPTVRKRGPKESGAP